MSDGTAQESVETPANEGIEIPEELLDSGDEDNGIDLKAISELTAKEPEKSPLELEAEKLDKDLNTEEEGFDPLKALEEELAKERDTSKKEEKDQSDTSSEDKDKVEAKEEGEEKEEEDKEPLKPLSHKEFVEMLDESGIKITKKVDGKEVEISASEAINKALNDYSGHEAVEQRFSELDKKTKNFHNDVEKVSSMIESFSSRFKANDFFGGLESLAEVAGVPAYALKESAIQAVVPEIERRAGLTEADIKNQLLLEQNKYFQKLNESEAAKREEKQKELENYKLDSYYDNLRKTHDITEKEWDEAFEALDKRLPEGEKIVAKDVLEEVKEMQEFHKVDEKLGPTFDMLGDDVPEDISDTLLDLYEQYPDLTAEDFQAITKESIEETIEDNEKQAKTDNVSKALSEKVVKGAKVEETDQGTQNSLDKFVKKFQESLNEEDNWNS